MAFNLISEAWIPVRRRSGGQLRIPPWGITEAQDSDPIISVESPRPDFNGALVQFLIGLIQTTCPPKDSSEWRKFFDHPPDTTILKTSFDSVAHAFNLDGAGPRFLQEQKLAGDGKINPIQSLFIEAPGEQTLRFNTDHFIKRGEVTKVCPLCGAMAILSLQTNSPSGGKGHRTSIRGGGPLTTLLLGDTLWETVWLNVLDQSAFISGCGDNPSRTQDCDKFPWLAPTRTSEPGTGVATTPEDAHPAQLFWGMPRRIWLNFEKHNGECSLCDQSMAYGVSSYRTQNYGINYSGPWRHPLSPYNLDQQNFPLAMHPRPGGITYRHWLGVVVCDPKEGEKYTRDPALVIKAYAQKRERRIRSDLRVWAFGYEMDKMKAVCWYDSTMPLILVDPGIMKEYEFHVSSLIRTSNQVAQNLVKSIKNALLKNPESAKGDFSFVHFKFWQNSEPLFYRTLEEIRTGLVGRNPVDQLKITWVSRLHQAAEKIFDENSQSANLESVDPQRIALAWNDLRWFNSPQNSIIHKLLRLPNG